MLLRNYQEDCLVGIAKAISEGHRHIINVLPTGAGKTLIETKLTDKLVEECDPFECIVHLCHLSDITHKNMAYYKEHGKYGASTMAMERRDMPDYSHKVVFATMQTMAREERITRWKERLGFKRDPKYFIIDEVHLKGCASYDRILASFPKAKMIGFTATPFRKNHPSLNLFDGVGYVCDMNTLIEEGYLTRPHMYAWVHEDTSDIGRIRTVYSLWKKRERDRGLPGLLVCPTVDQAKVAFTSLATAGVRTRYFDGKTPQKHVNQILVDVEAGDVDILVVCKRGQLGMDLPSLGFVMLPYGVKSVVTFLQIIGRVVRKHPDKAHANIYLWGDAPAVKRGLYKQMLNYALKVKRDPEEPGASLEDELDFLEQHEEPNYARIEWTKEAIRACKALASGGLPGIAQIVERKEFPTKYAKVLERVVKKIVAGNIVADSQKPSDMQLRILSEFKFDAGTVNTLDKGEASALIAGFRRYFRRGPHILPRGKYAGRHVSETTPLYRARVRDPIIRAVWANWVRCGRPAPDEDRR